MTIKELIAGGSLLAVMTLIQLSPIKLDPWTLLGKLAARLMGAVGKALNRDVLTKVAAVETKVDGLESKIDAVEAKVDAVKADAQEQAAVNARARILRFGDEVLHGTVHSKDHFDQTLRDIKTYNQYCATHVDFENRVTELTSRRIEEVYLERLKKNDFL